MTTRQRIFDLAGPRLQGRIDRARYAARLLPRVADDVRGPGACASWPEPYRACLVISADLELAWAWRYANVFTEPLGEALRLARRSRDNLPRLLDVFSRYDVPVTWATVGHLFLSSCDGHDELPRLPWFSNDLWTYRSGDWFDADPRSDVGSDPEWYGPDMVEAIVAADGRHEIGCHSFSHVDFADETCPPEVARAELECTTGAAARLGLTVDTMVFPGNRAGNLAALAGHGFRAYRFHGRDHLDVPRLDEHGMWRIPGGICCERPPGWSVRSWVATVCRCIDAAIASGTLVHLWFHPSCDPSDVDEVFPAVLAHATARSGELWRATMRDVAEHCASVGAA